MLSVNLHEEPRKFQVHIGEKLVGQVMVYRNGHINASIRDTSRGSGYRWIEGGFKSLHTATNCLLRAAGYGNCAGVEVDRCHGFRSQ